MHARFAAPLLRVALLLALFVAVAGSPFRLTAQESSPASSAANTSTPATETAKPEAANSEEAQTNAFLLDGPIVKWLAKTLNVDKRTASNICLFTNFFIIVLGIGIPLYRFVPKMLRGRGEKVRVDLDTARKATEEANARLSAIEAKLAGLDGEIALIRSQVELESKQDEARIKSTITEESARIVAAAEQELAVAAAQAKRGLRLFAADLAITQATQQLKLTPENDQALIAEFLKDVSSNGSARGGQN